MAVVAFLPREGKRKPRRSWPPRCSIRQTPQGSFPRVVSSAAAASALVSAPAVTLCRRRVRKSRRRRLRRALVALDHASHHQHPGCRQHDDPHHPTRFAWLRGCPAAAPRTTAGCACSFGDSIFSGCFPFSFVVLITLFVCLFFCIGCSLIRSRLRPLCFHLFSHRNMNLLQHPPGPRSDPSSRSASRRIDWCGASFTFAPITAACAMSSSETPSCFAS